MELLLRILKWSCIAGGGALLLTALKPVTDRRYRVKWRYWAWLALAVGLLLAPVPWGTLLPEGSPAVPPPMVLVEVPRRELRLSRTEGVELVPAGENTAPSTGASVPPAQAAEPAAKEKALTVPLGQALTAVWLAGAGAFLLYHLTGTLWLMRKARRWRREPEAGTLAAFADACGALPCRRRPCLWVSAGVYSPMLLGLLRPRLVLPAGDYDRAALDFILRHELTHYRRHDLWYQLVLLAANAVHWFNPLAYLLRREAGADLELTCDDTVVADCDSAARRAYSETLLASVHRQKGLPGLSTHFYGGARVMKARFRNILGGRARKRGAIALALALLLTLAAACAFGVRQQEAEPLTAQELAEYQTLLDGEWNGFLSERYTDVRYLSLYNLFYLGAGISVGPGEDETAALDVVWGGGPDCPVYGLERTAVEDFLEETTGYHIADFESGSGQWTYLEDSDTYFFAHGDTNYTSATVTGGERLGDTVTLTLSLGYEEALPAQSVHTLTLVDGKVRSFTDPLDTAAEPEARAYIDAQIKKLSDAGVTVTDRYMYLWWNVCETGDTAYYVGFLGYGLRVDDEERALASGAEVDQTGGGAGWVTEPQETGSPVLLFRWDPQDGLSLVEQAYARTPQGLGYSGWDEYCWLKYLGMDEDKEAFPTLTDELKAEIQNGHQTGLFDWRDVARTYLGEGHGQDRLAVLRTFSVAENAGTLLVRADGADSRYLLLRQRGAEDLGVSIWQVTDEAPAVEAALPEGAERLTDAELAELTAYFVTKEHNGLLRCRFAAPLGLRNLLPLFYDQGTWELSEEERGAVEAAGIALELDPLLVYTEDAVKYLEDNLALSEEDARWTVNFYRDDLGTYLPELDAYISQHGDTLMEMYAFDSGYRCTDGTVVLDYAASLLWDGRQTYADQAMTATLQPRPDGGWYVSANDFAKQ